MLSAAAVTHVVVTKDRDGFDGSDRKNNCLRAVYNTVGRPGTAYCASARLRVRVRPLTCCGSVAPVQTVFRSSSGPLYYFVDAPVALL